ncbi:MAG: hypothetical protein WCY76_08605 [Leucobacter sp.]
MSEVRQLSSNHPGSESLTLWPVRILRTREGIGISQASPAKQLADPLETCVPVFERTLSMHSNVYYFRPMSRAATHPV